VKRQRSLLAQETHHARLSTLIAQLDIQAREVLFLLDTHVAALVPLWSTVAEKWSSVRWRKISFSPPPPSDWVRLCQAPCSTARMTTTPVVAALAQTLVLHNRLRQHASQWQNSTQQQV
jgi:hypothetical protein